MICDGEKTCVIKDRCKHSEEHDLLDLCSVKCVFGVFGASCIKTPEEIAIDEFNEVVSEGDSILYLNDEGTAVLGTCKQAASWQGGKAYMYLEELPGYGEIELSRFIGLGG